MQPIDTSMVPSVKPVPNQGEPYSNPGRYIRLVGKLNYQLSKSIFKHFCQDH